jgi:hypothetical protein
MHRLLTVLGAVFAGNRFLIVLGVVLAGAVVIQVAGFALFLSSVGQVDPYPAFMADYPTRPYPAAESTFSEFLGDAFPTGSDAKDAITRMTKGGFKVTASSSDSVELRWWRREGPCSRVHTIIIGQSADGTIAKITGGFYGACL